MSQDKTEDMGGDSDEDVSEKSASISETSETKTDYSMSDSMGTVDELSDTAPGPSKDVAMETPSTPKEKYRSLMPLDLSPSSRKFPPSKPQDPDFLSPTREVNFDGLAIGDGTRKDLPLKKRIRSGDSDGKPDCKRPNTSTDTDEERENNENERPTTTLAELNLPSSQAIFSPEKFEKELSKNTEEDGKGTQQRMPPETAARTAQEGSKLVRKNDAGLFKEPDLAAVRPGVLSPLKSRRSSPGSSHQRHSSPGSSPQRQITPGSSPQREIMPGSSTRRQIMPGGSPQREIMPGSRTRRQIMPGGSPQRPIMPGGSPQRPIMPGGSPQRPIMPGSTPVKVGTIVDKCIMKAIEKYSSQSTLPNPSQSTLPNPSQRNSPVSDPMLRSMLDDHSQPLKSEIREIAIDYKQIAPSTSGTSTNIHIQKDSNFGSSDSDAAEISNPVGTVEGTSESDTVEISNPVGTVEGTSESDTAGSISRERFDVKQV